MTIEIGCFHVDWTLAADTDQALAAATFDRLVDDVLDPVLEDALHDVVSANALVAIRSVQVAPIEVQRAEDAAAWAGAVSAAIAGAVAAGGPDVVRYRSPGSAVLDMLRRLVLGDTRREWAWRMLGLWPASGAALPADVLSTLLAASPAAVVPVLEAAGSTLPDALDLLGPGRLARLSAIVWDAIGADPVAFPVRTAASTGLTPSVRAARASVVGRAVDAEAAAAARRSTHADADAAVPGGTDVRAVALAALLVAHADPATVRAGGGTAQVAALLRAAADQPTVTPSAQVVPARTQERSGDRPPAAAVSRSDTPPDAEQGLSSSPAIGSPAATTDWAGLLFCLHVLRPLLEPGAAPGPGTVPAGSSLFDSAGAVAAMHALGLELCARAVTSPWEDGPGRDDPAVLTFCGLDPWAAPPVEADRPDDVAVLANGVVTALRARLAGRPPAARDDGALLRTVLRRHGTVVSDPGWRRIELLLDEVSVDLRAAMLDLDPGWLPVLGCVVRFGYG